MVVSSKEKSKLLWLATSIVQGRRAAIEQRRLLHYQQLLCVTGRKNSNTYILATSYSIAIRIGGELILWYLDIVIDMPSRRVAELLLGFSHILLPAQKY